MVVIVKKCRDAASRNYRKDHPDRIRKYMKEYVHEYRKNDKVREREGIYSSKRRADKKEEYRAMDILRNAIRAGRVVRPNRCQICNKECTPHGHHEDYSLPLAVLWLCAQCHKMWSKQRGQ